MALCVEPYVGTAEKFICSHSMNMLEAVAQVPFPLRYADLSASIGVVDMINKKLSKREQVAFNYSNTHLSDAA